MDMFYIDPVDIVYKSNGDSNWIPSQQAPTDCLRNLIIIFFPHSQKSMKYALISPMA